MDAALNPESARRAANALWHHTTRNQNRGAVYSASARDAYQAGNLDVVGIYQRLAAWDYDQARRDYAAWGDVDAYAWNRR